MGQQNNEEVCAGVVMTFCKKNRTWGGDSCFWKQKWGGKVGIKTQWVGHKQVESVRRG